MYTLQSPLFNADKINTPILFLHGTADTNVPIGESIQMFTALKLLGKPTAFVRVEGENHHILDYEKRILWNNTIYAWFAKWLKDQPEWWDALYPPKKPIKIKIGHSIHIYLKSIFIRYFFFYLNTLDSIYETP